MQNGLDEYRTISLSRDVTPADLAYAAMPTQEGSPLAGTRSGRGIVTLYSLDGTALRTWNFQNICSGIDFSLASNSAYVATADSHEICRVDVRGTEVSPVAHISGATNGPVAIDDAAKRIYVRDVPTGTIYEYSMAAKIAKVAVTGLSAPIAMAFDAELCR